MRLQVLLLERDRVPSALLADSIGWNWEDPAERHRRRERALRTIVQRRAFRRYAMCAAGPEDLFCMWSAGDRPKGAEHVRGLLPGDVVGRRGGRRGRWHQMLIWGWARLPWAVLPPPVPYRPARERAVLLAACRGRCGACGCSAFQRCSRLCGAFSEALCVACASEQVNSLVTLHRCLERPAPPGLIWAVDATLREDGWDVRGEIRSLSWFPQRVVLAALTCQEPVVVKLVGLMREYTMVINAVPVQPGGAHG